MRLLRNTLLIPTALFAVLFMSGCKDPETSAQTKTIATPIHAARVSVVNVEPTPIKDVLVLPGTTEAWQDVRVAAEAGGRIEWIRIKEGDTVKKGQILAGIDSSAHKVALDRAEAAFKLADELSQRREQLFEQKMIARESLDRSMTEKTLARDSLRQAKVEHNRCCIKAPIGGIINHLYVDEGEFVERGDPMVDIVNVDKIKLHIHVPELDVRYLSPGQATRVTIDAFRDHELPGTVDFIAFKADPTTKTFLAKVVVDNAAHLIRPGMIGRVTLLRRVVPDALVAPLFALVDKGGEHLLFVEKDGVAHARTVALGIIDGDRVQIAEGLEPGDRLIVVGQTEVEEGMKVLVK
jgi:membrane fusion protein (multidrug efflux system)